MTSHKLLSNWYTQLAQHLEAGSRFAEALMFCSGPPAKDRMRLAEQIESGIPLTTVFKNAPNWLPKADRIFICAAAETGRLPQTFQNLAERHAQIGATQVKIVMSLLYPMGIFHVAALIVPIVNMIDFNTGFEWSASQHLMQSGAILAPVWCLIVGAILLVKIDNPLLPRILRIIPLLRRYSRFQALADLAYGLGTFLNAGLPMESAWRGAAHISRDPAIARAHAKLQPVFDRGEDPAHYLKQYKVFPPDFVAFYTTGAQSGKLDEMLIKAGHQFQSRANHAMTLAAIVYPTLLFLMVAGFIVYTIFQVFGGYLDLLNDFM